MISLISLAFLICSLFAISTELVGTTPAFQDETKPHCCPSCLLPLCLPTIDICVACPLLSCCRRSCQVKICVPGVKICLGCLFEDAISLNDVEKDKIELNFDDTFTKKEDTLIITHHEMMTVKKEKEKREDHCCHPSCKIAVCSHNSQPICRKCDNSLLQVVQQEDKEKEEEQGKKSCCARSCRIKYCREHNKICMGCNQQEEEQIFMDEKFLRSNEKDTEEVVQEILSPISLMTEIVPQNSDECCPSSCKVRICRPQFMLCAVCDDEEEKVFEEESKEEIPENTSCCQDSCKVKICRPDSIVCMNCELSSADLATHEDLSFTELS